MSDIATGGGGNSAQLIRVDIGTGEVVDRASVMDYATPTGLALPDGLPYETWEQLGAQLRAVESGIQWWIGDWVNFGERKYGEKHAQAIEATGYDYDTINIQRWVASKFEFIRRRINLSFTHHAEVAALPKAVADNLLDQAEAGHWSTRDIRRAARRAKHDALALAPPTGKYRVIYADPPWEYGNEMPAYFIEQADHYAGVMDIEQICAMPISALAEDSAVLFLWVTSPILREAFEVIEAWGFEYKTSFVWDKIKHNMGHYNSVRHELLLVCVRGSCPPDVLKLYDSVVSIERGEHSEKPEKFREIIDTLYPLGRRIELFARKNLPGEWVAYGNQID